MNAPFRAPAIEPTTQALFPRPGGGFDEELTVIALTRVLTSYVESRNGFGLFLEDPAVSFLRAQLYNATGINGWTYLQDAEACRRLRIWFFNVRTTDDMQD